LPPAGRHHGRDSRPTGGRTIVFATVLRRVARDAFGRRAPAACNCRFPGPGEERGFNVGRDFAGVSDLNRACCPRRFVFVPTTRPGDGRRPHPLFPEGTAELRKAWPARAGNLASSRGSSPRSEDEDPHGSGFVTCTVCFEDGLPTGTRVISELEGQPLAARGRSTRCLAVILRRHASAWRSMLEIITPRRSPPAPLEPPHCRPVGRPGRHRGSGREGLFLGDRTGPLARRGVVKTNLRTRTFGRDLASSAWFSGGRYGPRDSVDPRLRATGLFFFLGERGMNRPRLDEPKRVAR